MRISERHLERGGNSPVMLLAVVLLGLLLALLTTAVASVPQAKAAVDRRAVSAGVGANGFPLWYQDAGGTALDLCLDGPPLCLAAPADLTAPDGEAFWFDADASMGNIGFDGGGRARLVLAVEAAFADANANSQISFGRVRVLVDHLRRNTAYKVTYPYGTLKLKSDDRGQIKFTRDIGCVAAPCNFAAALRSPVFKSFLRWDPRVRPLRPPGFLGNPGINHKVVGSPLGTNFFLIEGPNVGGTGPGSDHRRTSLFSVQGKIR